jgi:hypothetical protein
MLIEIVTRTPLWVWGLFAALLALGLYQRRTRQVRPGQLLILPVVLLVLGVSSLAAAFTAQPVLAAVWLAALGTAVMLGLRLPPAPGTHWDAPSGRLQLPGSWLPMVLILIIFTLRYTAAVSLAMHPAWRQDLAVQVPLSLAFGALSGLFLGRALGLRRLATMGAHGQPA